MNAREIVSNAVGRSRVERMNHTDTVIAILDETERRAVEYCKGGYEDGPAYRKAYHEIRKELEGDGR